MLDKNKTPRKSTNRGITNLHSLGVKNGDRLELTDYIGDGKQLGVFATVVDSGHVRINGYTGSFSLSGGAAQVFGDMFPDRRHDRLLKSWSFRGPLYWVTDSGETVHELSPQTEVSPQTPQTPRVECGPGTHVFGGGLIPVKR